MMPIPPEQAALPSSVVLYRLRPGRAGLLLGAVALGLVLDHLAAMQVIFNPDLGLAARYGIKYWHLALFDLDAEESFGTWFSAVMLLIAGQLLLAETLRRRACSDRWWLAWAGLAAGFHLLSIDEVVGLHEWVNTALEDVPWTIFGFWILGLVGFVYLPFLWRYRWRTALLFVAAGLVYGCGAVGVEHWTGDDVRSLSYNMWTALEEGMEMGGVILFIYALLDHLGGSEGVEVRVVTSEQV